MRPAVLVATRVAGVGGIKVADQHAGVGVADLPPPARRAPDCPARRALRRRCRRSRHSRCARPARQPGLVGMQHGRGADRLTQLLPRAARRRVPPACAASPRWPPHSARTPCTAARYHWMPRDRQPQLLAQHRDQTEQPHPQPPLARRPARPAPGSGSQRPRQRGQRRSRETCAVTSTGPGISSITSRVRLTVPPRSAVRQCGQLGGGMHSARRGPHPLPPVPARPPLPRRARPGRAGAAGRLHPRHGWRGAAAPPSPSRWLQGEPAAPRRVPCSARQCRPLRGDLRAQARHLPLQVGDLLPLPHRRAAISSSRLARYRSSGASIPAAYRFSSLLNAHGRHRALTREAGGRILMSSRVLRSSPARGQGTAEQSLVSLFLPSLYGRITKPLSI